MPAPNCTEPVLRALMDFLYTDSFSPFADPELTCSLLIQAAAMGESRLVALCEVCIAWYCGDGGGCGGCGGCGGVCVGGCGRHSPRGATSSPGGCDPVACVAQGRLVRCLERDNACQFLDLAETHCAVALRSAAVTVILRHFGEVSGSGDFAALSEALRAEIADAYTHSVHAYRVDAVGISAEELAAAAGDAAAARAAAAAAAAGAAIQEFVEDELFGDGDDGGAWDDSDNDDDDVTDV